VERSARRVVKIAPGRDAVYWNECLDGGSICAGWPKIGDMTQFESKSALKKYFAEVHSENYNGHAPTISKKGIQ
jgi:5-methylcytosine-specific restriction protein B